MNKQTLLHGNRVMKAEINHEIESAIKESIDSGRYDNVNDFVHDAICEKLMIDRSVDARYVCNPPQKLTHSKAEALF